MIEKLKNLGFNSTVNLDPILTYTIEGNGYDIYLQIQLDKNSLKLKDINILSSIKKTTDSEELERIFSEYIVDFKKVQKKYKEIIKLF